MENNIFINFNSDRPGGIVVPNKDENRSIEIDGYQRAARLFEDWYIESDKIITGEDQYKLLGLVSVLGRLGIAAIGGVGGGKSEYARSFPELIDLDQYQFVRVPMTASPIEIVGGTVTTLREIEANNTSHIEKRNVLVKPLIDTLTAIVLIDEASRHLEENINALLRVQDGDHKLELSGKVVHLDKLLSIISTFNPGESREYTRRLPSATISRIAGAVIVGDNNTNQGKKNLLNSSQKSPKVEKVVSIDELLALNNLINKIRIPEDKTKSIVRKMEIAQKEVYNETGLLEHDRPLKQVGIMIRTLALLRGTGEVNNRDVEQAILFYLTARIGSFEKNPIEASKTVDAIVAKINSKTNEIK